MPVPRSENLNAFTAWAREVDALCAAAVDTTLPSELRQAYVVLSERRDILWQLYADKGRQSARLQYLYASRHVLDILCKGAALDVTFGEAGVTESLSDEFAHFNAARKNLDDEIAQLEAQLRGNRPMAIGVLTANRSNPLPLGSPDNNSAVYRGSPLFRPFSFYF